MTVCPFHVNAVPSGEVSVPYGPTPAFDIFTAPARSTVPFAMSKYPIVAEDMDAVDVRRFASCPICAVVAVMFVAVRLEMVAVDVRRFASCPICAVVAAMFVAVKDDTARVEPRNALPEILEALYKLKPSKSTPFEFRTGYNDQSEMS